MTDIVNAQVARALSASLGASTAELSELIADKVRFLRWRSAVRTLEAAEKFARPYGGLKKAPPLKFFLPFMENCSLEEENDEVTLMWAQLLVSASIDFKSGHLLFMRILKEITAEEAKLLERIATHNKYSGNELYGLEDAEANFTRLSSPASPLNGIDYAANWAKGKRIIFEELQPPGVAVNWIYLMRGTHYPKDEIEDVDQSEFIVKSEEQISVDILLSLNLIHNLEQTHFSVSDGHDYELKCRAYCITAMGTAFYRECSGNRPDRPRPHQGVDYD